MKRKLRPEIEGVTEDVAQEEVTEMAEAVAEEEEVTAEDQEEEVIEVVVIAEVPPDETEIIQFDHLKPTHDYVKIVWN